MTILYHFVMGLFKKQTSSSSQWLIIEDDPDEPGRNEPPQQNICIRAVVLFMVVATVVLTSLAIAILIAASSSANQYWEEEMELGIMAELKSIHLDGSFKILATNTSATVILNIAPEISTKIKITFENQENGANSTAPESCLEAVSDALTCLSWNSTARFKVVEYPLSEAKCLHLKLEAEEGTACLELEGRHVYGGPELLRQKWPSEKNQPFDKVPYLAGYEGLREVVTRYWITSKGEMLFVPYDVPLFWSQDSERLCFTSAIKEPYNFYNGYSGDLDLIVCGAEDTPSVYKATANSVLSSFKDVDLDSTGILIWQTWAKEKGNKTSQSTVIDYATQIREHQFPGSQIEVDDNWESCYGQADFDAEAMPDPKEMAKVLHNLDFNVTLWTHPFINSECPVFSEAENLDLFIQGVDGSAAKITWWHGEGGLLNFFNSSTVQWFSKRLYKLKSEYDIDGFKFDTGGVSYMLSIDSLPSIKRQPAEFEKVYEESVIMKNVDSRVSEISLPLALRMFDQDSDWGDNNGLGSLIPTLLTYNLVGHSVVIPTMTSIGDEYPEKELYIRWLQAATFMPVMQISYPPWDFDEETVEIAKKCVELHVRLADSFYTLARQRAVSGIPINLPVWWIAPHDSIAQTIDSEFLLGEDILVAPVLVKGASARDIYLPEGVWGEGFEQDNGAVHRGPVWLRNYPAPLNHLPFFQRLTAP